MSINSSGFYILIMVSILLGCISDGGLEENIQYTLNEDQLPEYEKNIDHAGMIADLDKESFKRGREIYNFTCYNCHGNPEHEGSLPTAFKFWSQQFKAKSDPFSMYQILSRGTGGMPPQLQLVPQEKYDVIHYIREEFVKKDNITEYFPVASEYLASLPVGSEVGPEPAPKEPWADMDYGDFLTYTYEVADAQTSPRNMSGGKSPLKDENFSNANFAYKGVAVRLDEGDGGVAAGKAWMVFDHDLMRVAGAWTGEGFIDWEGILLNGRHNISPRTVGEVHFSNPVLPGWANPKTGSFDDPRFTARDGRKFGPLPHSWVQYKGIYHHGNKVVFSYRVGDADVLELLGMEKHQNQIVFTRTIQIKNAAKNLKMHVANDNIGVALVGGGAELVNEKGQISMKILGSGERNLKLLITKLPMDLDNLKQVTEGPIALTQFTKGGAEHYPERLRTNIGAYSKGGAFETDMLHAPVDNPWKSRLRMSGIDFFKDANRAVVCCTEGDVWTVEGLTFGNNQLIWRRIASGLFQPLGVRVIDEQIYVTCRDQLVKLVDLNGDGETDFYECFNDDHQVTDHFHEFAMGLQVDAEGNLYYAKSGRHAREALVPQHGTLIKVSKDGSKSEIIARGMRAANGVCINPDGSFFVTDQEGYWNPMNRINWIDHNGFYGNMFGYDPPVDSSDAGMVPPMAWVDKKIDRSPSELVWVESKNWGPFNGSLLSLSYGFGTVFILPHEKINGQMQGGLYQLPIPYFETGVMRGRFNTADGQLYACGMSAWGTQRMDQAGGLYRIRYTGKPVLVPIDLNATKIGMRVRFSEELDRVSSEDISNFEVKTWELKRTRNYGSDHYNEKQLEISSVKLQEDKKTIMIVIPDIEPVWQMEIAFALKDGNGVLTKGIIQNTIHNLDDSNYLNL